MVAHNKPKWHGWGLSNNTTPGLHIGVLPGHEGLHLYIADGDEYTICAKLTTVAAIAVSALLDELILGRRR